MKQPILIAVGGTGQNVVASYLRLAELAGFTPAPFFVVDSDTNGQQGKGLSDLTKRVRKVVGGGSLSQRWKVNPYPQGQADRSSSFGNLLDLRGDTERAVFDCLFSEEAERTPIRDGMYGRPAIGASCMRLKLQREDDDLREMKELLLRGEKHVILVGSCFGGTGSGGVPILAQEFARLNTTPGYKLTVQAVVFLPWFRLELPPGDAVESEKRLHLRLNANFDPNAAASIRYFRSVLGERGLESLVFLGFHDPSLIARVSSESNQTEAVHPLNLFAAALVHGLFNGTTASPRGVSGYWYDAERGLDPRSLTVARDRGGAISVAGAVRRSALREKWLGILQAFFTSYYELPRLYRPALVEVALDKVRGRQSKDVGVLAQIRELLEDRAAICRENLAWIEGEAMTTGDLLPLAAEERRLQADLYQQMCDDPLPVLTEFCARPEVATSFQAGDLAHPAAFAEAFSERFLDHLGDRFQL